MKKLAALGAATALALAGCSAGSTAPDSDARLDVLASFYPLQFLAEEVGGDLVSVSSLTPAGAEPHDLELAPAQVAKVGSADVVFYLSGFQPSVDSAIDQSHPAHAYDAAHDADLMPLDHDHDHEHDHDAEDDHDHEHDAEDDHDHEHGEFDPHFWLDPARMAAVAPHLAETLGATDPDNAQAYADNAKTVAAKLTDLASDIDEGLSSCTRDTVVVSHEAYGYLLDGTGIEQLGLSGVDPEADPSPATLADLKSIVTERGVTTIFTESLINPKAAKVFAQETGASVEVLDPLETQVDSDAGYVEVMTDNLAKLREALECS